MTRQVGRQGRQADKAGRPTRQVGRQVRLADKAEADKAEADKAEADKAGSHVSICTSFNCQYFCFFTSKTKQGRLAGLLNSLPK
jgi:hypothetical protein